MGNVNKVPNNEYKKVFHIQMISKYNQILHTIPSMFMLNDRMLYTMEFLFQADNDIYDGDNKLFYDLPKNLPLLMKHAFKLLILSKHYYEQTKSLVNVFLTYHWHDICHYHIGTYNIIDYIVQYNNEFFLSLYMDLYDLDDMVYIHMDSVEFIIYNNQYKMIPILFKHGRLQTKIIDVHTKLLSVLFSNITTKEFLLHLKKIQLFIFYLLDGYKCNDIAFYHLCKNKKINAQCKISIFMLLQNRYMDWNKNTLKKIVVYCLIHKQESLYEYIIDYHYDWHSSFYNVKHINTKQNNTFHSEKTESSIINVNDPFISMLCKKKIIHTV